MIWFVVLILMLAIEAPGWLFLPWAIGFVIELLVAVYRKVTDNA